MSEHDDARVVQLGAYRRTAFTRTATTPVPEPIPSPWASVCRLGTALRTFGRELRAWAGAWLRAHRLGYVERAHAAGYVDGYCDGVSANPTRSA